MSKDGLNSHEAPADSKQLELKNWVTRHKDQVPPVVIEALDRYLDLTLRLQESKSRLRGFLVQLRKALGITPSSEKNSSSKSSNKGKKRHRSKEELVGLRDNHDRLEDWHRAQAKKHGRKAKKIEDRLKSLDEIELSAEELAECKEEQVAYHSRLNLGGGHIDPSLESENESLMTGITPSILEDEETASVSEEVIAGREVLDRTSEVRTRFDFSLEIKKVDIEVEKIVLRGRDGERVMVSASTAEYGPEGYSITWGFLASLSIMVTQYAIPLNRLANMLSSPDKTFTSGLLSKYFSYMARRFLPVYVELFDHLSDSDVISGDDTTVRVIEVSRYLAQKRAHPQSDAPPPPWLEYESPETSRASKLKSPQEASLGVLAGERLPFVSPLRASPGSKTGFHTTVISGRSDPKDPRSGIVFYRSHFGGFGDLLSALLAKRSPAHRDLWVQSDLSTVNLLSDKNLASQFAITYAGCASHARRPFAIFEHDDPDNCAHMLHLFKGLYIYEQGLDLYGRNIENVTAVRNADSRKMWDEILALARSMETRWSPKTELGQACGYIIKNFEKLTAPLSNPRLSLDNNFSERALRLEKLIEKSALFRTSLEGRFALDIMRTVTQTAIVAGVDVEDYLKSILRADQKDIEEHPEKFIPLAFKNTTSIQEP